MHALRELAARTVTDPEQTVERRQKAHWPLDQSQTQSRLGNAARRHTGRSNSHRPDQIGARRQKAHWPLDQSQTRPDWGTPPEGTLATRTVTDQTVERRQKAHWPLEQSQTRPDWGTPPEGTDWIYAWLDGERALAHKALLKTIPASQTQFTARYSAVKTNWCLLIQRSAKCVQSLPSNCVDRCRRDVGSQCVLPGPAVR